MKVTNIHGLPEAYWRACAVQRPRAGNRISVTELLQPPQLRQLLRVHRETLTEDCADMVDAFFGTAVHAHLEQFASAGEEAERMLEWHDPETGWTVHGTPDVYGDGVLTDWKTTRVRALGYDRQEWQEQTNLYAHLLRRAGYAVDAIVVWALLKDYDPQKRREDGYPRAALVKIPMPVWPDADVAAFLERRLRLHELAEDRGIYGECTDEERWKRDTWAVVPRGKERAIHVAKTKDEARDYANAAVQELAEWRDYYDIVKRDGEPARCLSYCPVRSVCPQWMAERPPTLEEQLDASVRRLIEARP